MSKHSASVDHAGQPVATDLQFEICEQALLAFEELREGNDLIPKR